MSGYAPPVEHLDAAALARLLPYDVAVPSLEEAFRSGLAQSAPLRSQLANEAGTLLLMPAAGPRRFGVKVLTVRHVPDAGVAAGGAPPPLIDGVYVLFDEDLRPVATIDGPALTAIRTATVSALATGYLARPTASRLVLFGAGAQAFAHADAMASIRPVEQVVVVSRGRTRAEALVARLASRGLDARVGTPEAVADADLVCTCTTSRVPLFDGALLPAGVHVNAVGTYEPDAAELDEVAIARSRLVVEQRSAALAEAGEVVQALRSGAITEAHILADLAELVAGTIVRRSPDEVTIFKSVGIAGEDLALAETALAQRW